MKCMQKINHFSLQITFSAFSWSLTNKTKSLSSLTSKIVSQVFKNGQEAVAEQKVRFQIQVGYFYSPDTIELQNCAVF